MTEEFYMDGYLRKNLGTAKDVIKKDWDMLFVVDGGEGSGKSVLAMTMAKFCDPTLSLDRIVFTPKDFKDTIMKAQQYQSVVYDEAYTGLSSRATMSLINRTLISMLAEIRQKNLFVFIVMPCFFDLDKYVALWRSRALIHVYTGDDFKRGFFAFYNADRKKSLYINGKKFYSYSLPKPNFIGRFTNVYQVDEVGYKKKKNEPLLNKENVEDDKDFQEKFTHALFLRLLDIDNTKVNATQKIEILGISKPTYYAWLRKFEEEERNS